LRDAVGDTTDELSPREGQSRYVSASEIPGTIGQAIALGVSPGDAGYLTAPSSPDLQLGSNYTIEAWLLPTEVGGWNRLVLQWGNTPDYAYHVSLHNRMASLFHGQSDGQLRFAEGGSVVARRWYHLAAVAHTAGEDSCQSTLRVYLNGRLNASATFDGTSNKLTHEPLGIGDSSSIPNVPSRFRGYLDEVAIWDRPLGAQEIAARFASRAEVLRELERVWRAEDRAQRERLLAQVAPFGVEEVVFAERGPGRDPANHYYANFGYSCIDPSYWIHSDDGGRLCKLNLRTGDITALIDDPAGAVRDPQVHHDGNKVLFSYRPGNTHHYHLYEINLDGSGLRQITDGPWDDVEPAYLPDGDVVFCSTRCRRYIGCWLAQTAILHRCDASGGNLRMISSGSFTENTPAVLPDGRVLYTRWEYVNRDPVSFHHLWTINPDGTGQMVYFGNMHPGGVFIDAQPIPGTQQVLLINSPSHGRNEHAGFVAIASAETGPDEQAALKNVSRTPEYRDPYPLSSDLFLVARANQLLLMNSVGETEVLHEASRMLHEPRPVLPRPVARRVPREADLTKDSATVLLSDVYAGRNMAGVRRGTVKKLLVMEDLPKPANFHGGGSQPVGHGVTSTLKRILGTVPVESDGSAFFKVPAMRSIYFALLDERDQALKQMRSFVTLQPGEALSCVGCHEPRTQTAAASRRPRLALLREPSEVQPISGVPGVLEFPRHVQPILDRHCVRCHNARQRDGGVNLVGDRGPVFSLSYYALFLHWQIKDTRGDPRHGTGRQPGNDAPFQTYSSASELMRKIDGSHHDVELTPDEEQIVRLWIDSGAQYPGTYAAYGTGQIGGCWGNNKPIREMTDAWPCAQKAAEAIQRRCGVCHPEEQLPRHITARIPLDAWGDMLSWTRPLSRYSRHRIFDLTRPEQSLILTAPLSRAEGGGAEGEAEKPQVVKEDLHRPPQATVHPVIFRSQDDPDYQAILSHLRTARDRLREIKRFDMPGFRPNEHYVREMQRYGVLPSSFDPALQAIDVYATDEAYWRSFWHRPTD
jgi:hypothetical protein